MYYTQVPMQAVQFGNAANPRNTSTFSLPPLTSLFNSSSNSRTNTVPQLSSPASLTVPTQLVQAQSPIQQHHNISSHAQFLQQQQQQPVVYLQHLDNTNNTGVNPNITNNNIPTQIANVSTITNTNYVSPYSVTSPMLIHPQIPSPINSPEYVNYSANNNHLQHPHQQNGRSYSIPYATSNLTTTNINGSGLLVATQNLPQDYIYQSNYPLQRSISPLSNHSSNSNNLNDMTTTAKYNMRISRDDTNLLSSHITTTTKKNTKMLNFKRETCDSITKELPKRRRRTTKEQKLILKEAFQQNKAPTKEERLKLAEKCNMTEKAIQVWFQNQRQYIRKEQNSRNLHFYQIVG